MPLESGDRGSWPERRLQGQRVACSPLPLPPRWGRQGEDAWRRLLLDGHACADAVRAGPASMLSYALCPACVPLPLSASSHSGGRLFSRSLSACISKSILPRSSSSTWWVPNHASNISWATASEMRRRLRQSTLASLYIRAPRAVSASAQRAARIPETLLAAMLTPVPVQQNRTPWSQSPDDTRSATRRATPAHCVASPSFKAPWSSTSIPCSESSRATPSATGDFSSLPMASLIAPFAQKPPTGGCVEAILPLCAVLPFPWSGPYDNLARTAQARGWLFSNSSCTCSSVRWVYTWVVAMLACPSKACTCLRLAPPRSI